MEDPSSVLVIGWDQHFLHPPLSLLLPGPSASLG